MSGHSSPAQGQNSREMNPHSPHKRPDERSPPISGRIFLGRLRPEITRQQLIEALIPFGRVLDARIVASMKEGRWKRFAFCDLENDAAASAAIAALHGSVVLGESYLLAAHSTDTTPSPPWSDISQIPQHPTPQITGANPRIFGMPWACHNIPPGAYPAYPYYYGALHNQTHPSIYPPQPSVPQGDQVQYIGYQDYYEAYPMTPMGPVPVPQGQGPAQFSTHHHEGAVASTTLYVRGLPLDMDEMGLLYYYMPFGCVVAAKILRNLDSMRSRGAGFVEFSTREEAEAALAATNAYNGHMNRQLRVKFAPRQLHCSRMAYGPIIAMPYGHQSMPLAAPIAQLEVPPPPRTERNGYTNRTGVVDGNVSAPTRSGEPVVVWSSLPNNGEALPNVASVVAGLPAAAAGPAPAAPYSYMPGHVSASASKVVTGYPPQAPSSRRPLRNLSVNGSASAANTPAGPAALGPAQYANQNGINMQRTSSAPLPNVLSALEKEAICSRVKAAARSVHEANNSASSTSRGFSSAQGTSRGTGVSADSEDTRSVTDSVDSCGTTGGCEEESVGIANAVNKMTLAA